MLMVLCDLPGMISAAGDTKVSGGDKPINPREVVYDEPDGIQEAKEMGTYYVNVLDGGKEQTFVNVAEGYSIVVPVDMKVTDMSNSEVVSVLEDAHRRLEIYVQRNESTAGYVAYGYRCLNDKENHKWTHNVKTKIAGRTAYVREWNRSKLKAIPNDHNYYAAVDIIVGGTVYDFFFSSDEPFWKSGYYHDIVNSFKVFEAKHNGVTIKGKPSGVHSYWNQETRELYSTYLSSDTKLDWGIYNPTANYGYGYYDLLEKEKQVDHEF
ncbi:MAG: hypothetical protein IK059_00080, partial [Firmicutes bacterium]|nr:hypothetical protein [Bacillota bacterium]